MKSPYDPLPDLALNYGAAFNYEIPGLSNILQERLANQDFKMKLLTRPSLHRLRVFRQQTNQLYLGVSLSQIEYKMLSNGSDVPALWDELSLLLKSYGITVSPKQSATPIQEIKKAIFPITPSISRYVAQDQDGVFVFLVGDSAVCNF